MKKILCIITSLGSGGAERQLTGLAILLSQRNYHVKVIWYADEDFYLKRLADNGIEYKRISAKSNLAKLLKIGKEIVAFRPNAVISYLTGPTYFTCLLRKLGLKFPLIVSERNTTQSLDDSRELRKFKLQHFADFIVPNSYTQGRFIESNFPENKDKVNVITNFTDTDFFVPAAKTDKIDLVRKTKIAVVARVIEQKNVKAFIRAIANVVSDTTNFEVNWYGDAFEASYREECLALTKALHIEEYLHFLPATHDILSVYQQSDVLCLPSIHEGFPNVICEAMSCGLPILCSDVSDNSMLVEDGVNGFIFDPQDIAAMSTALVKFIELPREQQLEMGKQSRARAVSMFSSETFVNKYINLINKL